MVDPSDILTKYMSNNTFCMLNALQYSYNKARTENFMNKHIHSTRFIEKIHV